MIDQLRPLFGTERNPTQNIFRFPNDGEHLAEITDPEPLIRSVVVDLWIVGKSAANIGVVFTGEDIVVAFHTVHNMQIVLNQLALILSV